MGEHSGDHTIDLPSGGGGGPSSPGDGGPGGIPRQIGNYRILGKLGEGGMGVVYSAEQQEPRRTVALKVIRGAAALDDTFVRMFQREVETLARLKHPDIASIYESGRTADGLHWFAMELVQGPDLAAYLAARPKAITPDELRLRLRLCVRIAQAVHYAHQRGVIHRDLKPSNIIVTGDEGRSSSSGQSGLPGIKILDFGLARLTDEDLKAMETLTVAGAIKGTLPYMSPEQARGAIDAIDVRTDVYALGVMLYETLTGQRPYDVARASLLEAVRVICEEAPRPMAVSLSGARRLDPDVETIVGKALQKEPDRRYASAAAFAEDIERYLDAQPIMARPPSAVYQARKFAQRHRPLVLGAAATAFAVAVGLVVSTTMYFRAERERRGAQKVAEFLGSMLAGVGAQVAQGRDTTLLKEILKNTTERIGPELGGEPLVEAHLRSVMGRAYEEIADFAEAEAQGTRALELYTRVHGPSHIDVAQQVSNLGQVAEAKSDYPGAEKQFRRAIEIARRVAPDDPRTLQYETNLANELVNQAHYDDAHKALEELLVRQHRILGPSHADIAVTLNSIGNVEQYLGKLDAAQEHYAQALAMHRATLGEKHPFVAIDLVNAAYLLDKRGKFAEAEASFRDALARFRELYPDGNEGTINSLNGLAALMRHAGRYEDAERQQRESVALTEKLFTQKSAQYARALDSLGVVLSERGKSVEADAAAFKALEIRREVLGPRHPDVASSLNNLGMHMLDAGRYAEAEDLLNQAFTIQKALSGIDSAAALTFMNNLARAHAGRGDLAGAEALFRECIERRKKVLGANSVYAAVSQGYLGEMLRENGRAAEGESLARDAAATIRSVLGPAHAQSFVFDGWLVDALAAAQKHEEAEKTARELIARATAGGAGTARFVFDGQLVLGRALGAAGKSAEALAALDVVLKAASGPSEGTLAQAHIAHGAALAAAGRVKEGRAEIDDVRLAWTKKLGPGCRMVRRAERELARLPR